MSEGSLVQKSLHTFFMGPSPSGFVRRRGHRDLARTERLGGWVYAGLVNRDDRIGVRCVASDAVAGEWLR